MGVSKRAPGVCGCMYMLLLLSNYVVVVLREGVYSTNSKGDRFRGAGCSAAIRRASVSSKRKGYDLRTEYLSAVKINAALTGIRCFDRPQALGFLEEREIEVKKG